MQPAPDAPLYRAPAPPMAPAHALSCPRCGASARPARAPQTCTGCRALFTLHAGTLLDPRVAPPPYDPRLPRIVVKSAGIVLMKQGVVAPEGVTSGTLDPITGMIPMDQWGVLFPEIFTVAVWRKIDWVRLVVGVLIPLPIALLFLAAAIGAHPAFLLGALPFGAGAAYMIYRAAILRAHMARVVGSARTVTIRFDSPMWRRRPFHDELLRRAGIAPSVIA